MSQFDVIERIQYKKGSEDNLSRSLVLYGGLGNSKHIKAIEKNR